MCACVWRARVAQVLGYALAGSVRAAEEPVSGVHVFLFGSEDDRSQAMEGLRSASAFVKGELGRRLKMRRTPEVVFVLDRGIERGTSVLGLLNRLEEERQEKGEPAEASEL